MNSFKITIDNFLGGYCPAWYADTYPVYGNKNMAGSMANVDLMNPAKLSQGLYPAKMTDGDESNYVATLIQKILNRSISDKSFAVGGNKLYELTYTAVIGKASNPVLPHTITAAHTITDSVGIEYYKGKVYYSYYTSAAGDVGRYDMTRDSDADFDDDWATVSGSATIVTGKPLPLHAAGNDFLYLGNGNIISSWDNSTWTNSDLDLPTDAVICDIVWAQNRLFIANNRPPQTGNNKGYGSVVVWDGNAESWEDEIIIAGTIGALIVKDGIVYVFYDTGEQTNGGKYKLGYISGGTIKELATFKDGIPSHGQVCVFKNFIMWVSGLKVYAYGSVEPSVPAMLFQVGEPFYLTGSVGALSNPFGVFPMIASSNLTTGRHLASFNGNYFEVDAYWKSLMFPVGTAMIDRVVIYFEPIISPGARVDVKLTTDRGKSTITLGSITETQMVRKSFKCGQKINNDFRVELDWTNGSGTYPLHINRIEIYGETYEQQ